MADVAAVGQQNAFEDSIGIEDCGASSKGSTTPPPVDDQNQFDASTCVVKQDPFDYQSYYQHYAENAHYYQQAYAQQPYIQYPLY